MKQRVAFVIVTIVAATLGYWSAESRDGGSDPVQLVQTAEPGTGVAATVAPKRVALNTSTDDYERLVELGYNVFDVGPSADDLDALPEGSQGMLWVGEFTCDEGFAFSDEEFRAAVDELGDDDRVYGWYLIDEPDPASCPSVSNAIRERADYINQHAPDQVAFFSATDYEYGPLTPQNTHVDVVGFDPYPCRDDGDGSCDLSIMDTMIEDAVEAGFDRAIIAPVFQLFGTECAANKGWRLPDEDELRAILSRWQELVPNPPLEITYSWGNQEEWSCPTLADADGSDGQPDLQSIMREHNVSGTETPPPSPEPSDQETPDCTAPTSTTSTTTPDTEA